MTSYILCISFESSTTSTFRGCKALSRTQLMGQSRGSLATNPKGLKPGRALTFADGRDQWTGSGKEGNWWTNCERVGTPCCPGCGRSKPGGWRTRAVESEERNSYPSLGIGPV